jgi:hypothetical protein
MSMPKDNAPGAVPLLVQLTKIPEEELAVGLPEIRVNGRQLDEVSDDALEALRLRNEPPRLFQRGGALVRLRSDEATEAPALEILGVDALRGELARAATWYEARGGKNGQAHVGVAPPVDVVRDLLSAPGWPEEVAPPLKEVIEAPVFAADGTLVAQPGYHHNSRLWFSPAAGLVIPKPPRAPYCVLVKRAKGAILDDVLADFPFADQASRANALALLLLPFVRPLIDGPTPLHLIEAAKAGTGKGLLTDVICLLATGRFSEPTAEAGEGDEWRKRVLSALLHGPRFVLIDNINGYLNSGALASALTARVVKDRVLGTSRMAAVPVRCVWIATGNNVRMSTELSRRTPLIRLVSAAEKPWTRPASDFLHPDLTGYVRVRRGELIGAALTLCRAWVAAGRPEGEVNVGSYEPWSRAMSGLMDVIGVSGFMANAGELLDHANDDQAKWTAFVQLWWHQFGGQAVGAADLFPMIEQDNLLEGVLGDGNEASQRIKLGRALGRQRDACYGGRKIVAAGTAHNGATLYRLKAQAGG